MLARNLVCLIITCRLFLESRLKGLFGRAILRFFLHVACPNLQFMFRSRGK